MTIVINAGYLADTDGQSTEITVLSIPAEGTCNRTTLVQACTCPGLLRIECICCNHLVGSCSYDICLRYGSHQGVSSKVGLPAFLETLARTCNERLLFTVKDGDCEMYRATFWPEEQSKYIHPKKL